MGELSVGAFSVGEYSSHDIYNKFKNIINNLITYISKIT